MNGLKKRDLIGKIIMVVVVIVAAGYMFFTVRVFGRFVKLTAEDSQAQETVVTEADDMEQ